MARRLRPRSARRQRLDIPAMDPDDPYCFLVSSFADTPEFVKTRREGIDPATRRFGFPTYRIDEIPSADLIVEATREHIAGADFVIADLTDERANCYYEVGYAHALGRPVVHLIKRGQQPQFNVAGLQVLHYESPRHLRRLLERHILTQILTTHGPSVDDADNRGWFGRRSFVDPYIVTGRVRVDDEEDDEGEYDNSLSFLIDLRVRSVDPLRPLKGNVTFHLHDTFKPSTYTDRAVDGEAALTHVRSFGTFTVGVHVHQADVELELDLSTLPGAGAEFRAR